MVKLDHVKLAVKDWQQSRDWYVGNFGFKVEFQILDGGSEKRGVAALQDDAGLTLFLEQAAHPPAGCNCVLYFQIVDVDETYRTLRAKDVSFLSAPQHFFWGYGAELIDPDGHSLRIWDQRSMNEK